MKTATVAMGLALAVMSGCSTAANSNPKLLLSKNQCNSFEYIENLLEKEYGELPVAQGSALLDTWNSREFELTEAQALLYLNLKTKTYTLVAYFKRENQSCIVLTGADLAPVPSGTKI